MSLLSQSTLRAARTLKTPQQVRSVHFENVVDHTLPTDVKNKYFLAAKIITFGVLGFGTPFYAAYWHINKASA
ncbi:hypothetical protein I308_106371 [Cryptococcus tetragattii IND107]|uniref:Cytochrome c oxidase subunit 8, mitochondrial n=1 Tax=Cryptococcus tetragattii IND107 TaxID=1296105 RepID=A0ABR3BM93_9TREE